MEIILSTTPGVLFKNEFYSEGQENKYARINFRNTTIIKNRVIYTRYLELENFIEKPELVIKCTRFKQCNLKKYLSYKSPKELLIKLNKLKNGEDVECTYKLRARHI